MAGEFCRAHWKLPEHFEQIPDRDAFVIRRAFWPVSVKATVECDASQRAAKRDIEFPGGGGCDAPYRLVLMDVLMGVEMRGSPADERVEEVKLPRDLSGDGVLVIGVSKLIDMKPLALTPLPFAEINMKTDCEPDI
jgi:hypothetical protein